MTKPTGNSVDDFDLGGDLDAELYEEASFDDLSEADFVGDARQQLERRAETEWLKRELAFWDDGEGWDEHPAIH